MVNNIISVKPGISTIERKSKDSSVTIPHERTFEPIQPNGESNLIEPDNSMDQFCGCGWPAHMLVPKGSAAGTKFDLFVMISDFEQDRIDQEVNL